MPDCTARFVKEKDVKSGVSRLFSENDLSITNAAFHKETREYNVPFATNK